MTKKVVSTLEKVRSENKRLRAELEEAKETLSAIQRGEIDALVVTGSTGEQIYTLKSADLPYRVLVETMGEGAATLGTDGTIFYANSRLAEFADIPLEKTMSSQITDLVADQDKLRFLSLFEEAKKSSSRGEILFKTSSGERPTVFSMTAVHLETGMGVCLVVTDLTEQKKLAKSTEDIEHQRLMTEKAELALAARDEFLSIASHELKTPLTSLKLQLQMTKRNTRPELNQVPNAIKLQSALDISLRQVSSLTALVDDLLDVSKVQSGKLTLALSEFNLSELVEDIVKQFSAPLESAKCAVQTDLQTDIVGFWDRHRLEQVIVNLISNAIKYAPKNPIHISISNGGDMAKISVRDFGVGIAEANQSKIFERFERLGSAKNIGGLGLGLFIAKKIVETHQGTLEVSSTLGQGSTFTISIPLRSEI